MKAVWNGEVLAESEETITIEGNEYFPPESVHREVLVPSDKAVESESLGTATFYSVMVEGEENQDAAWTYEHPLEGAVESVGVDFSNYIAFWRGVEVTG